MKRYSRAIALLVGALLSLQAAGADAQESELDSRFATYAEARAHLGELFRDEKFDEAAKLLEWSRERFPDHLHANSFNLAIIHFRMNNPAGGIEAIEYALDRGVFFGKWTLDAPAFADYQDLEEFQRVKQRSLAMLADAEEKASMKIDVVTPSGEAPDKGWPLFIALHGGGENIEEFKPKWTSPALREKFAVAYVQSSQVASMTGFHWQDEKKTSSELVRAFDKVRSEVTIDPGAVIVGGFSSGGFASLVVAFAESLPARGFVALCPPVPESITDKMIERARERNLQGTILSTEFDPRLDAQRSFVDRLVAAGLDVSIVVTPDVGHWYPENLDQLIDEAIARTMADVD